MGAQTIIHYKYLLASFFGSRITALILLFFCCEQQIYAQNEQAIIKSTLIFPLQKQHVHASSIVSLPNGDLLAAWFQGSGEITADDVKIIGARLKKGQKTWSKPFLMADTYNIPDCNPVLFLNHHKKLYLVWIAVQASHWEYSILKYRTSVNYRSSGPAKWNW
jgi:predicted neuraminidase